MPLKRILFDGGSKTMAYTKAVGRAVAKYDKTHYKKASIKIPLDIWDKMQKCEKFNNVNQFLNLLIMEELQRDGLLPVDQDEE